MSSPLTWLPQTLKEIAAHAGKDSPYWHARLREFLDVFYTTVWEEKLSLIQEEPPLTGNVYFDAYMAAAAETLAYEYDLGYPRWIFAEERFLRRPYFPDGFDGMKAYFFVNTPSSFNRRMLFVGEQTLYRPLKTIRATTIEYQSGGDYEIRKNGQRSHPVRFAPSG